MVGGEQYNHILPPPDRQTDGQTDRQQVLHLTCCSHRSCDTLEEPLLSLSRSAHVSYCLCSSEYYWMTVANTPHTSLSLSLPFFSSLFFSSRIQMGNLLKVLTCTELEQGPNFFLDFESEQSFCLACVSSSLLLSGTTNQDLRSPVHFNPVNPGAELITQLDTIVPFILI